MIMSGRPGAVLACLIACSPTKPAARPDAADVPPIDAAPQPPFATELGFLDVEPSRTNPTPGHMFYVLRSADSDPQRRPLFVVWNGGPGFPTSLGLLVDSTGPYSYDSLGNVVGNASSLTALGSVLYIDQRLAGFSYED